MVGKTPIEALEALVELLDVAVVALRMMAASAGKNPAHFALHSGRIGRATKLTAKGISELQIQRAGRWRSRAFMVYMRDAGEGTQKVSATLTSAG